MKCSRTLSAGDVILFNSHWVNELLTPPTTSSFGHRLDIMMTSPQ